MGNNLDLNHYILPQAPKASCWSGSAKRIKCIPKLIQGLNCFNIAKTETKRQDKKKNPNQKIPQINKQKKTQVQSLLWHSRQSINCEQLGM